MKVIAHASVDSELPWTVEVDLPGNWDDSNDFSAWYSNYHMGGPGACVTYGPSSNLGLMMSCIYFFLC